MPTTRTLLCAAVSALAIALAPASIADVILEDDFTGADRSSPNGTIPGWDVANGVGAPSTTLQFFDGDDGVTQRGFHNNGANPGTFDVNNNMTAGGWDTTITLVVGGADINLTSFVIDIKLTKRRLTTCIKSEQVTLHCCPIHFDRVF